MSSYEDRYLLIGRAVGMEFRRENKTENYVVIPPALLITDADGATWTIGTEYNVHFEFNVLRNDRDTGEFASRIEYRKGIVTLYGKEYGRKQVSFNRRTII